MRSRLFWIAVTTLLYYGAARLGLLLAFENTNASPVWPPSGFAMAAIFLLGYRVWPGIFLGAFLANFVTLLHQATAGIFPVLLGSSLVGLGNTFEAVLGVALLKRFDGVSNPLARTQDVFIFVMVALLVCFINAGMGSASLYFTGIIPAEHYQTAWFTWWMGDWAGIIVLTPTLLLLKTVFSIRRGFWYWVEASCLILVTILLSLKIFTAQIISSASPHTYLLIPVLLWVVFRLDELIAMALVLLVSALATWNTVHGLGPLVALTLNESLLSLQIFVGIISLTMMALSSALQMQRQTDAQLRSTNESLENKIQKRTSILQEKTQELLRINDELQCFNRVTLDREEKIIELKQQINKLNLMSGNIPPYDLIFSSGAQSAPPDELSKNQGLEIEKADAKEELKKRSRIMQSLLEDLHEANKKSMSNLAAIAEFSSDAIIGKTLDGIITSWNLGAKQIYGYDAQEVVGKHILLIVPPVLHGEVASFLEQISHGQSVKHHETTRIRKDGRIISVSLTISPVKDSRGKIIGALTIARDITHRKLAEERFRRVVELSPNGIVIANKEGKIVLVNLQTEKLFGYSRDELIGKPIEILIPVRFKSQHPHHREGFVANPTARPMGAGRELFGLHKDGNEIPLEIGLNPIETEEGILIVSSIIDITERKRLEELKDNFLSTVSHELRTPMAILRMGVDNLEADRIWKLSEDERETIKTLKRNTDRLEKLINDLLDFSRFESGKTKLKKQNVSLDSLVDELLHNFQCLTKERGIHLEKHLKTDDPFIQVDPELLVRLLTNLLNNAIHFAKAKVILSVHKFDALLQVSISDDGPGIAPEHIPSLFNKFVQINRPHGGAGYKGTGLGLAICREIIQLYEGKIWVESTPGEGASFNFTIPLAKSLQNKEIRS